MKRQKWIPRLSVAALFALAVACGYWALASGCTTPSGGGGGGGNANNSNSANSNDEPSANQSDPDAIEIVEATCEPLDDQGGGFEINLRAVSSEGRQLSYARRIITDPANGSVQVETEVMADEELVMRMLISTTATGAEGTVEYGAAVSGAESASATVADGMVSGSVDGHAIVPMSADDFDTAVVSLEDGTPVPQLDVDADLEDALVQLLAAAEQAAGGCQLPTADPGDEVARMTAHIPQQDTGHDSDPELSAGCISCWLACSGAAGGCVAGASAGCAALFLCPPCLIACEAIAIGVCTAGYVGCVEACNVGGAPCCPVACGEVACCDSGETCLNSTIGLCCSPGKTPCAGEACCSSTQDCIESGPNAGICCEPENICGNACCESTDSCIEEVSLCCPAGSPPCDDKCCSSDEACLGDGLCCEPQHICGNACCDELDSCIASLSLCCGFNSPACNDRCCESGESCLNGTTCCPSNRVCGNICCPESTACDSSTLTCTACPNPTDTPCTVGGCCPAGMNCTDFEGICCPQGETYCDGACRPVSQCLN